MEQNELLVVLYIYLYNIINIYFVSMQQSQGHMYALFCP